VQRKLRNLIAAGVAAVALAGLAAAGLAEAQSTSPKPAVPKKPPPAQGTSSQEDKQIEAAIVAKLAKSKIGKDGFKVHVQGGVATWEGTTDVLQHKGAATRMAKTAGARAVVNHIKVTDAAKQKATDNLDEGRRRAQVKRGDPRSDTKSQP
jgi:osmotically-inducible protein OsmY